MIQLYEMIVVRHGLMLVGPTGGGKSSNLHVLEETLSRLKQMGKEVLGGLFSSLLIRPTSFPTRLLCALVATSVSFCCRVRDNNSVPCRYIDVGVVGVAHAPLPGQAQSCGTSAETT